MTRIINVQDLTDSPRVMCISPSAYRLPCLTAVHQDRNYIDASRYPAGCSTQHAFSLQYVRWSNMGGRLYKSPLRFASIETGSGNPSMQRWRHCGSRERAEHVQSENADFGDPIKATVISLTRAIVCSTPSVTDKTTITLAGAMVDTAVDGIHLKFRSAITADSSFQQRTTQQTANRFRVMMPKLRNG